VPGPDRQTNALPAGAGRVPARTDSAPSAPVVAAAGTAVAGAAKVGRLLTRSGWGLARRLPGGRAVQREVQRLQNIALDELRRLLDVPVTASANGAKHVERRVFTIIDDDVEGPEPLRSAMSELLERSVEVDRTESREYLYGNIISQLVPDEARILAALAGGAPFAAIDVVAKHHLGRGRSRTVLANASSVGRAAGVATPDSVPAYVTRLHQFGLVEFGPADDAIAMQFDILAADSAVQAAEASVEARREGSAKHIRKTLTISSLGRDFWAACDPSRSSG
jgi:hypothetical protein